jgi:hypothetical protein
VESLFALSLFVVLALALVGLLLILDARGERKALRAALDAMQRRAQGQDEQMGAIAQALTRISKGQLPPAPRRPAPASAPVELGSMTEAQRRQALTVEMVRPELPMAARVGAEVIELDAETVARIEALQEDVNAGRVDGSLLQRVIDAGLEVVGEGAPPPGEHVLAREGMDSDGEEPRIADLGDEAPVTPTKPTGR